MSNREETLESDLAKEPATTLYHYTSQNGLLGIIAKKEMWATHNQYLNDGQEFLHAIDLVKAELHERLDASDEKSLPVYRDMAHSLDGIAGINVCVCSFSENRDSLSQWRAYGGSSGFAIGFNPDYLAEIVSKKELLLVKCLYDGAEKSAFISRLVTRVFEENVGRLNDGDQLCDSTDRDEETGKIPVRGGNLRPYLLQYALMLKDESFSEECEWRIISDVRSCTDEKYEFRTGASTLVPYYRMPLSDSDQPMTLDEVLIGPTSHPEQSRRSVKSFLFKQSLRDVPVNVSKTPYRSW